MRLDFNVLWVEDNQANVNSQKDRIAFLIRKEGFKLCVQFASSVDEANSFVSNDIFGDHIDLILMDYDLGPGKKGDQGLVEVRQVVPYKDIVFYSGLTTTQLRAMVASQQIQGVYASSRQELPDTVFGVFENLVHKVLDIDHSRGIVMGATSEIDEIIGDSLNILFEGCDDNKKRQCLEFIEKRLKEKEEEYGKALAAVKAVRSFNELGNHHGMYTSDDKIRLLRKSLKLLEAMDQYDNTIINYQQDVTPMRNLLAHVRVVKDGFSRKLVDKKGKELTSDQMRQLRVALLDFQDFFDDLLNALSNPKA